MSRMISKKLGDVCQVINGRAYKQEELLEEGKYRVLRVGNFFSNNSWYYSNLELTEDKFCKLGDLLYAWSASFGPRIWKGDKTIYHYHIWKIVEDEQVLNKAYLYYYLQNKTKSFIASTHGSVMLHLTKTFFEGLVIQYPESAKQQFQIAKVLSDLDSKIELNNKINAELEAMAKLIYDYWFVQFDFPNAKGKPYKSSGGKMVWCEELKKEIPEGWEPGVALDIFEFNPTLSIKKGTLSSYIDMNALPETGFMTKEVQKKEFNGGMKFQNGDLAIARITPCLENGKTGLITLLEDGEIGFGSTEFIILRGKEFDLRSFAACLSRSEKFRKYAISKMTGTSGRKRVSSTDLASFQMPIPNGEILKKFELLVSPAFKKATLNAKENQKLSELRDWLLPMLMNGQVQIKDTDVSKGVKQPVEEVSLKPINSYFYQTQVVAAIVNASKQNKISHGEMTLAKYSYLLDKIYKIPTLFSYDRWHLGPYPKEMKKVVNNKKFFKIQNNEVSVVPQKKEYAFEFQQQVEDAVTELASIFNQYKGKERSHQTELLATVCKVVEDIKSTDLKAVRESMREWVIDLKTSKFKNKAEKFSEQETELIISFMIKKGWDKLLTATMAA